MCQQFFWSFFIVNVSQFSHLFRIFYGINIDFEIVHGACASDNWKHKKKKQS